ncbi:MAG: DNA mismatch endonuclease Vsr [Thermoplasmatales archaeon]|nr:MAG: DNA mismatch endonuclease Vsr [Thermoplasmatales archaeon]
MSNIKGKNTKPEESVRKFLFSNGFRYRKNDNRYPGKPDIVLPKYKTIIFIHGCFWHGHKNCKASKLPETNKDFWEKKISNNIKRDKQNVHKLKEADWNVIIIWQCEIKNEKVKQKRFDKLIKEIVE